MILVRFKNTFNQGKIEVHYIKHKFCTINSEIEQ